MIGQGIPATAEKQELITAHGWMDDTDVDTD